MSASRTIACTRVGPSPAAAAIFRIDTPSGARWRSPTSAQALPSRAATPRGKALHLHLIGISGYRTPQHSLEVGGFADDPHTRGEASDTPGIEGVPESMLERHGLSRPFPGPAEADHIQLA